MSKHKCVLVASISYLVLLLSLSVFLHNKFLSSDEEKMTNFNYCTVPRDSFHKALAMTQRFCSTGRMIYDSEETLKKRFGNYSYREEKKLLTRKIHFVAFGNDRFRSSKRRLLEEAKQYQIFLQYRFMDPTISRSYFEGTLRIFWSKFEVIGIGYGSFM